MTPGPKGTITPQVHVNTYVQDKHTSVQMGMEALIGAWTHTAICTQVCVEMDPNHLEQ